jgi:5-methyltetrahydrofolate--homocysteine methyltransferase
MAETKTVQQEVDERTNLTSSNKFELLLFRLGGDENGERSELYGINVFKIREIAPMPSVTAIAGAQRLFAELGQRIPVQAQFTLDTSGRMLLGTDVASAMTTIGALGVDVIGLNCSTGPEYMREPVRLLSTQGSLPIAVIPNAGLPINSGSGEAVYPLQPEPMAAMLAEFVREFGVRAVGGCCGSTPAHIRALVAAVRALGDTGAAIGRESPHPEPRVSSAMRAITLRQDPAPLLIGERLNAQGSRKVKRLLLADDYDALVDVAREQIESGAHVLDVCVDFVGRDGVKDIREVVSRFVQQVNAPLMLDSTSPEVMEAGLKLVGGRCILNSMNLEDGEARVARICTLARRFGAAVVCGTIDEDKQAAMARTAERKLAIAKRIHDLAVNKYALRRRIYCSIPWSCPSPPALRRTAATPWRPSRGSARSTANCPTAAPWSGSPM